MKVTGKILDMIRLEIESIDYGVVKITVNEKGNYIEIDTERRRRIVKDSDNEMASGYEKAYHNDGRRPDPIKL